MRHIHKLIATFFGAGYFPIAPGTFASAIVIFLYKYFFINLNWIYFFGLAIAIFILGTWASSGYALHKGIEDPRQVVIDEVLGQMLALYTVDSSWQSLILCFLLFRFFDILKPFPIKKAETFPGGWGIMLDDIVAGLFSSIVLNLYFLVKKFV